MGINKKVWIWHIITFNLYFMMHHLHTRKEEKAKPWSFSSPKANSSPLELKKIRILPQEPGTLIKRPHKRGYSNPPLRTLDPPRLKVRSMIKPRQKYHEPATSIVLPVFNQAGAVPQISLKQPIFERRVPRGIYESAALQNLKRKYSQNNSHNNPSIRYNGGRFKSQTIQASTTPSDAGSLLNRLNRSINRQHHKSTTLSSKVNNQSLAFLAKFMARVMRLVSFWFKLTKLCQRHAKKRRLKIQSQFNNFEFIIQDAVRHYNEVLYLPLKYYRELIKSFMRNPNCYYNDQALKFLNSIVAKLKTTGLPSELLNFLRNICLDRSFVPSGLLSKYQLKKIDVSAWFGCSVDMTPESSCLIIGHIMCCRIFCYEILLQPWQITSKGAEKKLPSLMNAKKQDHPSEYIRKEDFWRYKRLVYDIGSAFYTIYIRHFHRQIPNLNDPKIARVRRNLNLKYPETLLAMPQNYEKDAPKSEKDSLKAADSEYKLIGMGIIPNCNSSFYRNLVQVDDERVEEIRLGMVDWLMRIYNKIIIMKQKNQLSSS